MTRHVAFGSICSHMLAYMNAPTVSTCEMSFQLLLAYFPRSLATSTTGCRRAVAALSVSQAAPQQPPMISKCNSVLKSTSFSRSTHNIAAPRRSMASSVVPPAGLSQSELRGTREGKQAGAVRPDSPEYRQEDPNAGVGAPAFAGGYAGAPAGSSELLDDEAAPLRFKGTTPVRRGRTAVPGLATTCWGTEQLKAQYPQLREDIEADVAVVGGGIAGLTTAYLLAKAGKRVVVLESRLLGSGQTGRAVGDMTSWHTGLFSSLERWTSSEQRKQIALSNTEAIDFVENVIKTEGISCGFTRCPAFVLPSSAAEVPGDSRDPRSSSSSGGKSDKQAERLIMQELEACKAAGLDAKWADVGTAGAGGGRAIELPQAASLNPLQYIQGLAQAITEKYGGRIYENTRLRKADSSRKALTTMERATVRAKQGYVLATASPVTSSILDSALHVLALHGKQHVRRRYVVALKVPKFSGYKPGVFYDTAEPQHTALLTTGKQSGRDGYHDLLVVAGEAHDQGMRANEYPSDPAAALEAWARARWPAAGQRAFQWSYQYYQTAEDLGLYGQDPTATASKGTYVATGDCGRIMTGGTIGGNVIASQLLGWPAGQLHKNIYSPSRKLRGLPGLPAWSPRYFKTTINSALNMLLPLPTYLAAARDIESLPVGEGTIINTGPLALRKVAVYKDPSGEVHKFSGLCPHLGCLLQWNPEDKEFNCPCHGSCFSAEGKNLAGPATIDMSRLDRD